MIFQVCFVDEKSRPRERGAGEMAKITQRDLGFKPGCVCLQDPLNSPY